MERSNPRTNKQTNNGLEFTVIQKNVAKHAETEEPKKLYRELNSFENETLVTLA